MIQSIEPTNDSPVWITGVGAVTPIGTSFVEVSANLLAGKTGIREVTGFDASEHPCRIAGQVDAPPCPPGFDSVRYDGLFPLEQCTLSCCVQALQDSGLWSDRQNLRVGLVLGLASEWLLHWESDLRRGGTLMTDATQTHPSVPDGTLELLGLSGPALSVAAACASGNHAFAQARRWLQMGWVDVCVAGACDIGVTAYALASFGNLRALSRRNESPATALRPFDRERDGMVLGEGGAIFVLERADDARARQRDPYAELAAVGLTSDAYHLVIPNPDTRRATAAVEQALAEARLNPEDVDYVNAHATGTPVGDLNEARILQAAFGNHCARLPVSSTKSMTGHLLGAAAAVEALACLTAMNEKVIPPTINLDHPDPECNLLHVANQPQERPVRVALSNSFGFGGHNTSLILKAAG